MPVSDASAFTVLRRFGMLEFSLKRTPDFLAAETDLSRTQRARAKADWSAVDRAVAALRSADVLQQVSEATRAKLLGGARYRPQGQYVRIAADGTWGADYADSPSPNN